MLSPAVVALEILSMKGSYLVSQQPVYLYSLADLLWLYLAAQEQVIRE